MPSTNNWEAATEAEWSIRQLLPEVSSSRYDDGNITDRARYRETGKVTFLDLTQGAPGTEGLTLREYRITSDTVRKQWPFDISTTDWTVGEQVSELRWTSDGGVGALQGTITGNDSAVDSATNIGARLGAGTVEVRMKHTAGTELQLCWTTNASRTWNINRCARRSGARTDGRYNTYTFETRGWRDWEARQTLYQLRLEPSDSREVTSGTFYVDSIKLID
jgi:hypothetical protein